MIRSGEPGDSVIPEKNKNNKVNKNNRMFKQLIYLISFLSLVAVLPAGATETEKDQRKFDYFFYEGLNLKNAGKFDAAYDAFNIAWRLTLALRSCMSFLLFMYS